MRLAILATHPIQYQVPLWRKLAALPECEVHVFYSTDMSVRGYRDREFGVDVAWDTPLLEGYTYSFLSKDPEVTQIGALKPNARGIGQLVDEFKPDIALMTAYWNAFHLGSWYALRQRKIPIVMRHEASDVAHARSGWKSGIRDTLLRRFYRKIDGFAYIGTEAKKHLLRLGVEESRLWHAPYCVDSDYVETQKLKWLPQRNRLRLDLGIGLEEFAIVFSGKLIPKKNPLLIVEAMKLIQANAGASRSGLLDRIHVIVAGDGELRSAMETGLAEFLGDRAHFLGFLNQSEMGKAYAMGDVLCLPSRRGSGETWGLVANEAMQWGLPLLLSDGVGSHVDLIQQKKTGWAFASDDAQGLAESIRAYAKLSSDERAEMSTYVVATVASYSIDQARDGILDACQNFASNSYLQQK